MRFIRLKRFTFWHYLRPQSYTAANRKRMAEEKATYLDHLERWLNYEDALDSPPLADGMNTEKVAQPVVHKRVDSFIASDHPGAALEAAEEDARDVAAKLKRTADNDNVTRLDVQFPLPSCARDEADQGWADDRALREMKAAQACSVVQKVKNVLGL
ncbi:uncharacterized protein EKO05_0006161 [Ascochyta rabiei]|uniref:Uncharacterized protein n=1 Tax=Didymella rabiei TaxID=5454 RepID=A0A163AUP9_DIDRA|nr:uncharacterized protein EKO05_0006161 [Ascochyta rabiei]KZM21403.1 hypothetical protein ST47_g7459 [Ascochyta rabiei]UPX15721.1 hypothetical protein EKO05_0006161 [Ascochyta rabiei]